MKIPAQLPRGIRMRRNKFFVDVSHEGERRTGTFASYDEALAAQKRFRAELRGELVSEQPLAKRKRVYTLEDALTLAEAEWAGTNAEKSALLNANTVLSFFGRSFPLADIDVLQVQRFKAHLKREGKSGGTINRKLAALSKMLRLAKEAKWIDDRPPIKREKESEGRHGELSRTEEEDILAAFREYGWDDEADALTVLVDTGMRVGEFLRLTPEHLGKSEELGRYFHLTPDITKNGTSRTIPMTNRVAEIVDRLPAGRYLFLPGEPGDGLKRRYGQLRRKWLAIMEHLGWSDRPDYVIHLLRHTCCSRLVRKRLPLKTIMKWMGHKTIAVTARYTNILNEDLAGLRDALQEAA